MNSDHTLQNFAVLAGRMLLALIFVVSGFGKITGFTATAAYMASKGLPMPEVLLVAAIFIEFGGGLMLVFGYRTRLVAVVMFLYIIAVTLVFHNFWAVSPNEVRMQMINFMKNLSIMGGMLCIAAFGPGRYSLDRQ